MPKVFLRFILSFAASGLAGCLSVDRPPAPEASLTAENSPPETATPETSPPDNIVSAIPPEDTLDAAIWASLVGCWISQEGGWTRPTRRLHLSSDGAVNYFGSHQQSEGICVNSTKTRSLWGSMTMNRDTLSLQSDIHLGAYFSSGGGGKICPRIDRSETLDPVSAAFSFTLVDDTLRLQANASWPGYHYLDASEVPASRIFTRCTF